MSELLERIAHVVEKGKVNKAAPFPPALKGEDGADELTKRAVEEGIKPQRILNEGLVVGMMKIGVKFKNNEVFVPDVLIAAKAMKAGMKHIEPFFLSKEVEYKGKIVAGTVAGDLHDIGKNILSMILQGGGWEVVDLGIDVSADKFAEAVAEHKPEAVCMSALLTTTMVNMEAVVKKIRETSPETKTIVGGAPLTADFAKKIEADFYSPDPQGALEYLNSECAA
ncbi:MAG: cobalamin-binding protein [Ignavibacteriales bacterium]|nr:cobalamin-binding protein [Ignavibacteriales bacterium]